MIVICVRAAMFQRDYVIDMKPGETARLGKPAVFTAVPGFGADGLLLLTAQTHPTLVLI